MITTKERSPVNSGLFGNLSADIPAGFVVFLVALPLCMGIALASGAPLFSGIISGIIGGILIGYASGSPLGVSGPAAGLVVIVLTSIEKLGSFEAFLVAVILSGIIQLVLGFLKAGIIGYFFPSSVIKGMLVAIGITIALKQFPHIVGYDNVIEGEVAFKYGQDDNIFGALLHMFSKVSAGAIVISILSLAVLIFWQTEFISKKKFSKIIPGPLVVVVLGIILYKVFENIPALALGEGHLSSLPSVSSLAEIPTLFTLPDFSILANPAVYTVAFTIALIGSIETLLCVEAADKLDPHKRVTPTNRELKAQGMGNILSGFIGGLPITQVIVRSSANIQSGGKSKLSAIFHGFLLLFSVLLIPSILNMVPLASLSAILLVIGYKLGSPKTFRAIFKLGWFQFLPFIITVVAIIFTDLLIGITIGMVFSVFNILMANYRMPFIFHKEHNNEKVITLKLPEKVTFLNKGGLLQTLDHVEPGKKIMIDASNSISIDYDIVEVVEDFKEKAKDRNIEVEVKNVDYRMPINYLDALKEELKTAD